MANHEISGDRVSGDHANSPRDDSIAKLMRLAGPRPSIPADVQKRVHDRVRNEWQRSVRRSRTVRWGVPVALAASMVIAVVLNSQPPQVTVAPIATVVRIEGAAGPADKLSPGAAVFPGDAVATGVGQGVALAVRNGLSLRLAPETSATFDSLDEITLASGQLYADTGPSIYSDRRITVHTKLGSATDIGTQFAVAYLDGEMSVAVREGRVDVANYRGSYTAQAGEKLTLQPDDDVAFEPISPSDGSWNWAEALAPAFDIHNRSLLDFLKWAARETGKELVFENDEVRSAAMGTRLRGSVADLTPVEAIDSVLPTTRFKYRMNEHEIVIGAYQQ
jgi:hypothetical protein